jgi:hypothetical protein
MEYLVRWKDYGPEDDTWEPKENLKNAPRVLQQYESRGRASKKLGYHVMDRVTQDKPSTKNDQRTNTTRPNQPGLIHLPPGS